MTRLAVFFLSFYLSANAVIAQSLDSVDLLGVFLVPPSKNENGLALLTEPTWEEFSVLAALAGVERDSLERKFELNSDAGFKERKDRSALVDAIFREAQRYIELKSRILGSTFLVYSNIPVPKYGFNSQGFTFCVPSAAYPRIPNSSLLSDLNLQFHPEFMIDYDGLTGLFGVYKYDNCDDPKKDGFEDYYAEPVTIQGVYVTPNVSLGTIFFAVSNLDIAEKLSTRMMAAQNDTMQAEIVCSPLTFSSNAVGSCKPIRISFGFFTDELEILVQYVRTSDGSWGAAIGEKFK